MYRPPPTPIIPFFFEPQAPYALLTPCDIDEPDPKHPWQSYQPVRPVYVWNGVDYVYQGATPIYPPVWYLPQPPPQTLPPIWLPAIQKLAGELRDASPRLAPPPRLQ
jgi:hypothetical protein